MASDLLQRQCARDNHTPGGGECDECKKRRKDALQRAATDPSPVQEVPPIVYEVLRSPGEPLDAEVRAFMVPRFGHDFSRVRVHTDQKAAESVKAVNALAYTVRNHIAFGVGQYQPQSPQGGRLLAHELAHVVQDDAWYLHRWSAANHDKLTRGVVTTRFKDDFCWNVMDRMARFAGEMDIRSRNYAWYLGSKTPIAAPVVKYLLDEKEAPNHGEANLYRYRDRTHVNVEKMDDYTAKAAELANDQGITDQALLELGYGLHVGQDRGAHGEGLPGEGHAREFDPQDPQKKWKPDDPSQNTRGWEDAKTHTETVLRSFRSSLNASAKAGLKTSSQAKSTQAGFELSSGLAIAKGTPQFYVGAAGYVLGAGRVFGLWNPILKAGYGYTPGARQAISITEEAGLRLTRITPRIYVDVLGGGLVGYDFADERLMAGVSATVQAHYTGRQIDLGIMLKNLYDLVGNRNVLVIGVSARF